jgi:ABC-2 type transport system permease protein
MRAAMSIRRIRAIARKEMREYRRKPSLVAAMAIIPLCFVIPPTVTVLGMPAAAAQQLAHEHVLLYLLGIPALVPTMAGAYAVAGERQQGTLEPVLSTPVLREEFLLGKALAVFLPSVAVAYAVFALFVACAGLFADPAVASALLRPPEILGQVLFTPLVTTWSIWWSLGISARSNDVRVAQQLGLLAGLPATAVAALIAFDVIHPTLALTLVLATALLGCDVLGRRIVSLAFDREKLITGTR